MWAEGSTSASRKGQPDKNNNPKYKLKRTAPALKLIFGFFKLDTVRAKQKSFGFLGVL